MNPIFDQIKITVCRTYGSPFLNQAGIYQDGQIPMCRDASGKLWAISGHTNIGHIGVFCGNDLSDLKEVYPARLLFDVGSADRAFSRIRYPEGILARGGLWPFGLFICPGTGRFFCWFHNETGWSACGTGYDARGFCDSPYVDSDFRHVGLMHSDDLGRSWTFDRWVLTSEEICFTELFNPGEEKVKGQKAGRVSLGSGDFTLFSTEKMDYIYLFYNIIRIDTGKWQWTDCDTYVARARKRKDGIIGDFVKYYDGAFCEAGNFGRETPVALNTWHPKVVYSEDLKVYLMVSSTVAEDTDGARITDTMELRSSEDLLHWSEPVHVRNGEGIFGNHYNGIASYRGQGDPDLLRGKRCTLMTCHNGTDVDFHDLLFERIKTEPEEHR